MSNILFEKGILDNIMEEGEATPFTIASIHKPLTTLDDGLRGCVFSVHEEKFEDGITSIFNHRYTEDGFRLHHEDTIGGEKGIYQYYYLKGQLQAVEMIRSGFVNERWHFYYNKNILTKVEWKQYEEERCPIESSSFRILCDEQGRVIKSEGIQYIYDSAGRIIEKSHEHEPIGMGNLFLPLFDYKFQYDDMGLLVCRNLKYGNVILNDSFKYNGCGDIVEMKRIRNDGFESLEHFEYTYDNRGNWLTCKSESCYSLRTISYYDE